MTDFDLDRLGDVWRQQPDPAEMERLQQSAAAVSRRARWTQLVDAGAAVAVGGVVIFLVLSNPQIDTFLMGGAAILVLLYSNLRQRRLRQVELQSLTGGTEDMLDQLIERAEASLTRNRFSLIVLGPALVVGGLFAATVERRMGSSILAEVREVPMFHYLWNGTALFVLGCVVIFLIFDRRRGRKRVDRLRAMREAYRLEGEVSSAE